MYFWLTLNLLCNQGWAWTPDSPVSISSVQTYVVISDLIWYRGLNPGKYFTSHAAFHFCLPTHNILVDSGLRISRKSNTKHLKQERQVLTPFKGQFCFVKIIYFIKTMKVSGILAILELVLGTQNPKGSSSKLGPVLLIHRWLKIRGQRIAQHGR